MNSPSERTAPLTGEILAELEAVVAEAERVMAQATTSGADVLEALRDRCVLALDRVGALCGTTRERVVAGARQTDAAIRSNPYTSVGIALAAGIAIGLIIVRGNPSEHD